MHTRIGALAMIILSFAITLFLGSQFMPLAPPTVTLALMGDVMLGRGIAQAHQTGDWSTALAGLAPTLQSADLALANLESPLADPVPGSVVQALAAGQYNLCAPAEAVDALTTAGLDVLVLANNHARDCSPAGLENTTTILQAAGLTPLPPGEPLTLMLDGLRLAFLAFDDVTTPIDIDAAAKQIRSARQTGAVVIVSAHWGAEYHSGSSQRQQMLAQAMTEAGAMIIWGHHPHVLQPVVWLPGPAAWQRGGHDGLPFGYGTLVAYSLGNALFDQVGLADVRRSAVLLVTLDGSGVQDVQVIPIQINPLSGIVSLANPSTSETVLRRLGIER